MCEADETMRACAHSVNVLVGVHVVKRHASGEVRCNVVISVVIGVHVLLLVPLHSYNFTLRLNVPCLSYCNSSSNSFP